MEETAVRPATLDDVPELVRHRELLFAAMSREEGSDWRAAAKAEFEERLGADMAVYVIDAPAGLLAASGVGVIDRRLPGPQTPNGRWGHISGVVTDPGHRRNGHARAIMTALLTWFESRGVHRVDLHATAEAEGLYRSLGFTDRPTALTRTSRP